MKIGLLTYHWVANFGANLQTLSTIGFIKKCGYIPIIINWIPEDTEKRYLHTTIDKQLIEHKRFQQYYGNISEVCRTTNDIVNVIRNMGIDKIIIGSDAVLTYVPKIDRLILSRKGPKIYQVESDSVFPCPFWGDFLNYIDVPTVLMSASAQNTKYYHILFGKNKFSKALNRFKLITVRDLWTQKMISYLTGNTIVPQITPDPVFAFNYNIDPNLVVSKADLLKKYRLPDNYVLFTLSIPFFSKSWIYSLYTLFKEKGLELVELPKANVCSYSPELPTKISLPIQPLDWYFLIKYSAGYIGELMHPIIVSLHNSVPVFSIDSYGWKRHGEFKSDTSKIIHIMNLFDLKDNVYNINSGLQMPSPEYVFDKIENFDFDKCRAMANMCFQQYLIMMEQIIKL